MKKLISTFSLVLVFVLMLSLPTLAAGSDSWVAYIAYAEQVIRANEEPDFVDMALNTLLTESSEADPDGWPFDMFVGRGLFVSYDVFLETMFVPNEASGEASGETSEEASAEPVEVTNETFGSYVSYLRKYMEEYSDPKIDDAGKQMALAELDTVDVGSDVYAFPFDMFVNEFAAMTFDEFILSKNSAASVEPETEADFNAYVQYVRDYMATYNGEGAKEGFDEAGKEMALAELDNVAFGSSVNGFPFEMFVNEFGVATYEEFLATK